MLSRSTALTDRLMQLVDHQIATATSIPIIGLSGPQGSGKSTALRFLLENTHHNIAGLGLDDFYLTKADRLKLAESVSPLFETRGPPGTHDHSLLNETLDILLLAAQGTEYRIPKFDKPTDDRLPVKDWDRFRGMPDAIIIEGWMVGATLPPDFLTSPPINEVENRDKDGAWRLQQYQQLSGLYAQLWDRIDSFIHIVGPGFDAVHDWRLEQEAANFNCALNELPKVRQDWVAEFVQYFERLTISMQSGFRKSGAILEIGENRQFQTY